MLGKLKENRGLRRNLKTAKNAVKTALQLAKPALAPVPAAQVVVDSLLALVEAMEVGSLGRFCWISSH